MKIRLLKFLFYFICIAKRIFQPDGVLFHTIKYFDLSHIKTIAEIVLRVAYMPEEPNH